MVEDVEELMGVQVSFSFLLEFVLLIWELSSFMYYYKT